LVESCHDVIGPSTFKQHDVSAGAAAWLMLNCVCCAFPCCLLICLFLLLLLLLLLFVSIDHASYYLHIKSLYQWCWQCQLRSQG
jgi:hypothetical protein